MSKANTPSRPRASAGKGSAPRKVNLKTYQANYEAVFKKSSKDANCLKKG